MSGISRRDALKGAIAGTMLVMGCSGDDRSPPLRQLRRGLGGRPASLDPQLAADTYAYEVLRDFREGLVTEDAAGRPEPGQAAHWEVSADGRVYRFRLREGLRWSDGTPVFPADFAAALRRAVDPRTVSPNAMLLRPIFGAVEVMRGEWPATALGVAVDGERDLVIRLRTPTEFLPAVLAHPVTFPRGPASGGVRYNGAYVPVNSLADGELRAVANRHFREAGRVGIAAVRYVPAADESLELLRYRAGHLDVTASIPTDQVGWARRERPAELQLAPQNSTFFLGLNLRHGPLRQSPGLREALSLVIDRDWLTSQLLGAGQVASYRLVPPELLDEPAVLPAWRQWSMEARVKLATRLMASAGHGRRRPLRLRVLYNRHSTVRRVVLAIAAMWRERLGVEVQFLDEEFATFLESRRRRTAWDVVRLGWTADFPDAASFLEVFRSTSADNDVGHADRDYDAWLDKAASTTGAVRREALQAAEARLLGNHCLVPVYFLAARRLVSRDVVAPRPTAMHPGMTRHWRWAGSGPENAGHRPGDDPGQ